MIKIVTKQNFKEDVLEASNQKPVLVDFFATWCMPCKMMGPILEDLADEMGDSFVVAKVDVDEESELAGEFGIMSIPTIYVLRNGKVVEQFVGMQTMEQLKTALQSHV
ncbi:thioredoxin [Patescibacteria group bacterium]|nr:thioredoxin [Patescibacteria group bacterium]MBU4453165.1 thioredoxin [Patescibacteria group bacterium]MCG2687586.1 thioredoxin [Candidatus Parcubacteria bacterium]